jgi:integrase
MDNQRAGDPQNVSCIVRAALAEFRNREAHQTCCEASRIVKQIGWHTLKHSFGTLLKANGEDVKVAQELMRHANVKVTMDRYVQAVIRQNAKRRPQSLAYWSLMSQIRSCNVCK